MMGELAQLFFILQDCSMTSILLPTTIQDTMLQGKRSRMRGSCRPTT